VPLYARAPHVPSLRLVTTTYVYTTPPTGAYAMWGRVPISSYSHYYSHYPPHRRRRCASICTSPPFSLSSSSNYYLCLYSPPPQAHTVCGGACPSLRIVTTIHTTPPTGAGGVPLYARAPHPPSLRLVATTYVYTTPPSTGAGGVRGRVSLSSSTN